MDQPNRTLERTENALEVRVSATPFQENGTAHGLNGLPDVASDVIGTPDSQAGLPDSAQASNGDGCAVASLDAGGVRCARCQTTSAPGAWACSSCGAFLLGNSAARTHGLRSQRHPADLTMTADEVERGLVQDNGGADELSTLERRYVRHIRNLEVTLGLLMNDIARNGLLTPGGKVRDVYAGFLNGLDRYDRLSQRLGMKRRPRRISSPAEALAHAPEVQE